MKNKENSLIEYQPKMKIEFENIQNITPQYRMRRNPSQIVEGKFDRFMFAKLLCEITAEYSIEELNEALSRENDFRIIKIK